MGRLLPPSTWIAPLVAAFVGVAGCGGLTSTDHYDPYGRLSRAAQAQYRGPTDPEIAVRIRAQDDMHCAQIAARVVGGGGYVATGCGLEQSYTCWRHVVAVRSREWPARGTYSESATTCAPDGDPHPASPPPGSGQRGAMAR